MEINGIQAAIDAGKLLAAHVEVIDGVTCIVTPNGAAPIPAVAALQDKPRRRTGTAQLQSSVSFCDHVNRFKSESSAIFADEKGRQFVGVLNYHPAGAVGEGAAQGEGCGWVRERFRGRIWVRIVGEAQGG